MQKKQQSLNQHLFHTVSTKTRHCKLHKERLHLEFYSLIVFTSVFRRKNLSPWLPLRLFSWERETSLWERPRGRVGVRERAWGQTDRVSPRHAEHLVCPLVAWPTHCDSCCVVASWSLSARPPALKQLISVWGTTAHCNSCSHRQQTDPLSYSGLKDESEVRQSLVHVNSSLTCTSATYLWLWRTHRELAPALQPCRAFWPRLTHCFDFAAQVLEGSVSALLSTSWFQTSE